MITGYDYETSEDNFLKGLARQSEYCNCPACKFRRENYEMAYRIMRRDEAETYLLANGWKLFVDLCIKEKIIVMEDEPKLPGLPIGFEFPFSKREEWTDCVNNLYKQGFVVTKA